MREEQGNTQINATGDHTHIVSGDAVEQQHVGTQHISAMYVAHPAPPRIKPELLEPCPNPGCDARNPRHSQRCRVCEYPVAQMRAEHEAFLLAKRQFRIGTWMWTIAALIGLGATYANAPPPDAHQALLIMNRASAVLAFGMGVAVWVAYWWRYGRHA